jgi:hypothetical protein
MSDPNPSPSQNPQEASPVLHVQVTPGVISYVDNQGAPQKFYFQCNPESLTRSRTINRTDSPATNQAAGTRTARGEIGRRYTLKANSWKLDTIELWFDASMPHFRTGVRSEDEGFEAVQAAIQHLHAISEPGPVPTENESQTGAPPLPPTPLITLTLGNRTWQGHVSSLSIVERNFTPMLLPRQVKATLGIELVVTEQQLEQGKLGGLK